MDKVRKPYNCEHCFLGCHIGYSRRRIPTIRRKIVPPSSRLKRIDWTYSHVDVVSTFQRNFGISLQGYTVSQSRKPNAIVRQVQNCLWEEDRARRRRRATRRVASLFWVIVRKELCGWDRVLTHGQRVVEPWLFLFMAAVRGRKGSSAGVVWSGSYYVISC